MAFPHSQTNKPKICFKLKQLLQTWKLVEYETRFLDSQHTTIYQWSDLTLKQLTQLGLKTGHAKRFIRNVAKLINDHGIENIEIESFDDRNVCVVLLGETGVGKSTLMYSIEHYLNESNFQEIDYTKKYSQHGTQSQTQQ